MSKKEKDKTNEEKKITFEELVLKWIKWSLEKQDKVLKNKKNIEKFKKIKRLADY